MFREQTNSIGHRANSGRRISKENIGGGWDKAGFVSTGGDIGAKDIWAEQQLGPT